MGCKIKKIKKNLVAVGGGEREDGQVAVHQALRGAHRRDQEAQRRGEEHC